MWWFEFLKKEGHFDPSNNPMPVSIKEGFHVPHWNVLDYLVKISIDADKNTSEQIIDIIQKVSEQPNDNFYTWYKFIEILSNLSNEVITEKILTFIPTWFNTKFDNLLQSSSLLEKLLPKFLTETGDKSDRSKAEKLSCFIFSLKKRDIETDAEGKYYSPMHLYYLRKSLVDEKMISKIAQQCSDDLFFLFFKNLRTVLQDFPNGITAEFLTNNKQPIELKIDFEENDLNFYSSKNNELKRSAIQNFKELDYKALKENILDIIVHLGVTDLEQEKNKISLKRILFFLNNDLITISNYKSINDFENRYSNEGIKETFGLIAKYYLDEKIKQNPLDGNKILTKVFTSNAFNIPFIKKLVLYVIAENWNIGKQLFLEVLKNEKYRCIIFDNKCKNDVYYLLNKNQGKLNNDEKALILEVIENGPNSDDKEKNLDYWRLEWYSALRQNEFFKKQYEQLSQQLGIDHNHFENLGKIQYQRGSISPYSIDELIEMNGEEIIEAIHNFKDEGFQFGKPSIEGFADAIGKAVESNPQKFSDEIFVYKSLDTLFVYQIIYAFKDAWKDGKSFNWETVLNFCLYYISEEGFNRKWHVKNKDGNYSKLGWVIDSIAHLISEGTRNDNNAFAIELLPVAKDILLNLINYLEASSYTIEKEAILYVFNSQPGNVLRAILDYSLRKARIENEMSSHQQAIWEAEMKRVFEYSLENNIAEGYILLGYYFPQFSYLDKNWIIAKAEKFIALDDSSWVPFISGVCQSSIYYDDQLYKLFLPHFNRAVENLWLFNKHTIKGIVNTILNIYFLQNSENDKLLKDLINQSDEEVINEIINTVNYQKSYVSGLTESERDKIERKILELWSLIINKYETDNDKRDVKLGLLGWLDFFTSLNEKIVDLVLKSLKRVKENYNLYLIFEQLNLIKDNGDQEFSSKAIASILNTVEFSPHVVTFSQDHLISLVNFLYSHDLKEQANTLCNKLALIGCDFLKVTYMKNNP